MNEKIELKGIDKGAVLAALYNASKPQGMGFMQYDPVPMTVEEANELLKRHTYFDYLKGRVMKIDLSGDTLDPWGYDRDNGEGAAQKALASLQATLDPANAEILHTHSINTIVSAESAESQLNDKTTIKGDGKGAVVTLGLSDMKNHLAPKIKKAKELNENK